MSKVKRTNVKRAVESKRRDILTKYKEANMLLHEEWDIFQHMKNCEHFPTQMSDYSRPICLCWWWHIFDFPFCMHGWWVGLSAADVALSGIISSCDIALHSVDVAITVPRICCSVSWKYRCVKFPLGKNSRPGLPAPCCYIIGLPYTMSWRLLSSAT